jgi:hypothetical protein
MIKFPLIVSLLIFLAACSSAANNLVSETPTSPLVPDLPILPTQTLHPGEPPTPDPAPTATLAPDAWKFMPVFPLSVSKHIIEVYQRGLALGHDPNRFSKIGDCQNIAPYFLSAFDDPLKYRLGDQYSYLLPTIEHFKGSWSRKSISTHGGFNAATVLNSSWILVARPGECEKGETPAACELRVNNPSFAIISMEEAWSGDLQKYDRYMRMLVEYVLSQDVVPIIATRAELPNSLTSINAIVVQIAYDYDIPLWNFGASVASLPHYGLNADGFHLTPGTVEGHYFFDDPARMELGWTLRNLTALQSIDAVWHAIDVQP